jgi:hypothetical protein
MDPDNELLKRVERLESAVRGWRLFATLLGLGAGAAFLMGATGAAKSSEITTTRLVLVDGQGKMRAALETNPLPGATGLYLYNADGKMMGMIGTWDNNGMPAVGLSDSDMKTSPPSVQLNVGPGVRALVFQGAGNGETVLGLTHENGNSKMDLVGAAAKIRLINGDRTAITWQTP